jgi:hypothetical protein
MSSVRSSAASLASSGRAGQRAVENEPGQSVNADHAASSASPRADRSDSLLIDATLVRGVLVPASMRLLGARSWYAPSGLRRLHTRIGLAET